MKKYLKAFKNIGLIFFILINIKTYSQITTDNIKYWYYRNRLKYFVVRGDGYGESQIICVRNKIWTENNKNTFLKAETLSSGIYLYALILPAGKALARNKIVVIK